MRVVLDIETIPFSDDFKNAKTAAARLKHAPVPRIACVYNAESKTYRFFLPDEFRQLLAYLRRASEIITQNGDRFDFLVIKKHLAIKGHLFGRTKSIDLLQIMKQLAGFRVSLDAAACLNLGEGKKIKGKAAGTAPLNIAKAGCKSDVRQTYLLWKLYSKNQLKVPRKSERKYWSKFDDYETIDQNLPSICPDCGEPSRLMPLKPDTDEMTEGQFAEYLAGNQGVAWCPQCKTIVAWNS